MNTYMKFLYEFMSVFFEGIGMIIKGLFGGIGQMFNFREYLFVVNSYKKEFNMPEWLLVGLAILIMALILGLILFLVLLAVRKYIRFRKTLVEQEGLLNEVADLNKKVSELVIEKEKILAMKVSQLGLKPGEEDTVNDPLDGEKKEDEISLANVRFSKLHAIDLQYKDYKVEDYHNTFTLEELVELFRNFAASKLHLYYTTEMIRLFISSLSATRLVILQGRYFWNW